MRKLQVRRTAGGCARPAPDGKRAATSSELAELSPFGGRCCASARKMRHCENWPRGYAP